MRKEKETTIRGQKFKVTQLGFADGMEVLTTIGKVVGPVLRNFEGIKVPTAIIGDVISRLTLADFTSITGKLAKSTRIEREPGKWPVLEPEVDLAGQYDIMLRWLGFALEVNYGDFFAEGGLLSGLVEGSEAIPAA